jgi:hypothetical protein
MRGRVLFSSVPPFPHRAGLEQRRTNVNDIHEMTEIVEYSPRRLIVAIGTRRISGDPARLAAMLLMSAAPALVQQCGTPDNLVRVIRASHDAGLLAPFEHAHGIIDAYHGAGYVAPFSYGATL